MKYSIEGAPLPVVICDLEAGESMITEKGAMSWMTPNMKMETSGGGMGKMIGRMFSGENMFQNRYTAEGGAGQIAYASSFPGSILAFEIGNGNEIIAQKSDHCPRQGNDSAEKCFPGLGSGSGAVHPFQSETGSRLLRRRRFYYAETFRQRYGFCRN